MGPKRSRLAQAGKYQSVARPNVRALRPERKSTVHVPANVRHRQDDQMERRAVAFDRVRIAERDTNVWSAAVFVRYIREVIEGRR
jgi:hypothetical protein